MSVDLAESKTAQHVAIAQPGLKGTLLVHVPTRGDPDALRLATAMAEQSGARVIGVAAEAFEPAIYAGQPYAPGSLMSRWIEELHERICSSKPRFDAETAPLGERAHWHGETEYPHVALARHALGADWVVATRPVEGMRPALAPPIADLIMSTGLPVLVGPPAAKPLRANRIVVGWKDTREAARAVSDAMPLLISAERVILVSVCQGEADESEQESLEEVCQRLKHRGCNAVGERHTRGGKSVAEALIASAVGHGADLIVMGGYGHSRLREWAIGGVTRDLIAHCPVYVLFSH